MREIERLDGMGDVKARAIPAGVYHGGGGVGGMGRVGLGWVAKQLAAGPGAKAERAEMGPANGRRLKPSSLGAGEPSTARTAGPQAASSS